MKTCGYCGNTYNDSETKCPVCGSTLLKHSRGTDSAAADYDRIKRELEGKRKKKSMILGGIAAAAVLIVLIIIISTISHVNNPQRAIDSAAKGQYDSAVADIRQGNYDSALSTLDSIDPSWSNYSKVEESKLEAVKGLLLERADGYIASGDYASLIKLINSNLQNISGDAEIKAIYDNAVTQYRRQVIDNAEAAFQSGGYEEAIRVINNGLGILNGDQLLLNEKSRYEEMAPVALVSLTPFYEFRSMKYTDVTLRDKLGNTYYQCIEYMYGNNDWGSEGCTEIYVLNYAYSLFKGTLFVPEDRNSGVDDWAEYYFKVYGDGKLLYTSPNMTSVQYPVDFSIDVAGVDQLKFEWYAGASTWYVQIGIANAYLYK